MWRTNIDCWSISWKGLCLFLCYTVTLRWLTLSSSNWSHYCYSSVKSKWAWCGPVCVESCRSFLSCMCTKKLVVFFLPCSVFTLIDDFLKLAALFSSSRVNKSWACHGSSNSKGAAEGLWNINCPFSRAALFWWYTLNSRKYRKGDCSLESPFVSEQSRTV